VALPARGESRAENVEGEARAATYQEGTVVLDAARAAVEMDMTAAKKKEVRIVLAKAEDGGFAIRNGVGREAARQSWTRARSGN